MTWICLTAGTLSLDESVPYIFQADQTYKRLRGRTGLHLTRMQIVCHRLRARSNFLGGLKMRRCWLSNSADMPAPGRG
jgi:hypothetical protein